MVEFQRAARRDESVATTGPAGRLPEVHALDADLANLDAVATASAIASGALSAGEVLEAALQRAERVEGSIHAIVRDDPDRAREKARRLSVRGGLAGVPTYIKDMVDVAGFPTTWGSEALLDGPVKAKTTGIAQQFEAMGTIVIGKSAMPEFGFTASTEPVHTPVTRNPWNLDRSSGGSSGGSAALVAAGVVPIAHAADGGGSTRIPAGFCGLVGLKPTRWRLLPHREEQILPVAVTVDGVVTRTVRDTARFMALAEQIWRNKKLPPMGEVTRPLSRRLRIGAFIELPIDVEIDSPTRQTFAATIELLESLGHRVEETGPPIGIEFADDFLTHFQLLAFLATTTARAAHGRHVRKDRFTVFTDGLVKDFKKKWRSAAAAERRLRTSSEVVARAHKEFDLILTPVNPTIATPIGHIDSGLPYDELLPRMVAHMPYTPLANAAGTPAISLPLGFDEETNLPIGMMFSAPHGNDALLLELALELEAARPWI